MQVCWNSRNIDVGNLLANLPTDREVIVFVCFRKCWSNKQVNLDSKVIVLIEERVVIEFLNIVQFSYA